jgi:CMP-N,N'-diacetyllegionaminic acid synthase
MIRGETVLAVVIARGGSKGIARKNIRAVAGKPLIGWTIEVAKRSRYIDRLVLSSEDPEIISIAKRLGCDAPFVRPEEFATDEVSGVEAVLDAIARVDRTDWVVMLQPTSPFRIAEDIDGCIERCAGRHANACVTLTETEKSPYWMFTLQPDDTLAPVVPDVTSISTLPMYRQALPKCFVLNGAVYVARTDWLEANRTFVTQDTLGYLMPKERSLDVDSEFDWKLMEVLMRERGAGR